MTTPYQNIPTVLPGSDAATAVDEIGSYYSQHGTNGLDQAVADIIERHGGDPIKASAMRGAAQEMIDQNPANAERISKHLVGTTIADPAIAAEQASATVAQRIRDEGVNYGSMSDDQKVDFAMDAAEKSIANAGADPLNSSSRQAMREDISSQIAQGVSPGQAAAAAVAAHMAPVVGAANAAGGFDIYGYVTMLVHGPATYEFLSTENIHVQQTAIHNYLANISYLLPGKNYTIRADTIKTSGSIEKARVHSGQAFGKYHGGYFSLTGVSGTAFVGMTNVPESQLLGTGVLATFSGVRAYLAVFDKDFIKSGGGGVPFPVVGSKWEKWKGDHRIKPLDISLMDLLVATAAVIRF